jgi:hypothetical protein
MVRTMFSLPELDRYRRWSLAWVLGPLILGGLIVTLAAVALRAPSLIPRKEAIAATDRTRGPGSSSPGA